MKKGIPISLGIIFLVISIIVIVDAEMLTSSANVSYDSAILDEFNKLAKNETNNETFIKVLFYLEDSSRADSLISSFSKEEFQLETHRNNSNSISALITEETFFKLIQDENVKSIYYDFPVQQFEKNGLLNYLYGGWAIIIIIWIILIYFLARKMKGRNISKKIHLIFLSLILLEIIFFIISSILLTRDCGSPCDMHSPLNPFGYGHKEECVAFAMCLPSAQYPLIFIISDLLFFTVLTYIILIIIKKVKK